MYQVGQDGTGRDAPDVVDTLVDIAAGLAAVLEHFAPGQADLALNGAMVQMETEAIFRSDDGDPRETT